MSNFQIETIRFNDQSSVAIHTLAKSQTIDMHKIEAHLSSEELLQSQKRKNEQRRLEFLRARYLFHQATGCSSPLINDGSGAPLWPAPWKGSISHNSGHVAVAVTLSPAISGLGIDLEALDRTHLGLESRICTKNDSQFLESASQGCESTRQMLLCTIFSFKEALFKAIHPIGRTYFGLHDAEIYKWDEDEETIAMRVLKDTSPHTAKDYIANGYYRYVAIDTKTYVVSLSVI